MTLNAAQSVVTTGTNPAPFTPTASDTVAAADILSTGGCIMRVVTTGTLTNVAVLDPNVTIQGNPGTVSAVACPATGVRYILIPVSAINPATQVATVTFSSITGCTYDLMKF